jgi:hypothetical protein
LADRSPVPASIPVASVIGSILSTKSVAQAFTESWTTRLALATLLGELVLQLTPVYVYYARQLVGGMSEVQSLVVLPAAVRVREHRVRLLQAAELELAAARTVRVALLGEPAVGFSDLRLGGVARDAEYLIIVDLI